MASKGLSVLLGEIVEKANDISQTSHNSEQMLILDAIVAGKNQPRQFFDDDKHRSLVDSIQKNGVLQPIVVRSVDHIPGKIYEIIAGERRYRASLDAGLTTIPGKIIYCDDTEALEIGLIENLQRDDLNPMDEAEAFMVLAQKHHKTQDEIAKAVSKSRSYVANHMRLTTLPDQVKELVRQKKITAGHARSLVNSENPDALADHIMKEGLNVRQAEALRQERDNNIPPVMPNAPRNIPLMQRYVDPDVALLSERLQQSLGLRIKMNTTVRGGGTLIIQFDSFEQLDYLVQRIEGNH